MTTAGLELTGSVLRYTEIEQTGPSIRLLRLGNCDFEFDAQSDLYSADDPAHLESIGEALADVFEKSTASVFRFAVPPFCLTSFTAMMPAKAEADASVRGDLIAAEASILSLSLDGDLYPSPGASFRGSGRRLHIARAPGIIRDRIERICDRIPSGDVVGGGQETVGPEEAASRHVALVPSSVAARHLQVHLNGEASGPTLLTGCYSGSTDYAIVESDTTILEWTDEMDHPVDRLYFALDVLDRAGISVPAVSGVRLYGPKAENDVVDAFSSAFGERVRRMNPCPAVNVSPDQFAPDFRFESFASCIGAALS